jgi:hypothetical protein
MLNMNLWSVHYQFSSRSNPQAPIPFGIGTQFGSESGKYVSNYRFFSYRSATEGTLSEITRKAGTMHQYKIYTSHYISRLERANRAVLKVSRYINTTCIDISHNINMRYSETLKRKRYSRIWCIQKQKCYADDAALFVQPTITDVKNIKHIL